MAARFFDKYRPITYHCEIFAIKIIFTFSLRMILKWYFIFLLRIFYLAIKTICVQHQRKFHLKDVSFHYLLGSL